MRTTMHRIKRILRNRSRGSIMSNDSCPILLRCVVQFESQLYRNECAPNGSGKHHKHASVQPKHRSHLLRLQGPTSDQRSENCGQENTCDVDYFEWHSCDLSADISREKCRLDRRQRRITQTRHAYLLHRNECPSRIRANDHKDSSPCGGDCDKKCESYQLSTLLNHSGHRSRHVRYLTLHRVHLRLHLLALLHHR